MPGGTPELGVGAEAASLKRNELLEVNAYIYIYKELKIIQLEIFQQTD